MCESLWLFVLSCGGVFLLQAGEGGRKMVVGQARHHHFPSARSCLSILGLDFSQTALVHRQSLRRHRSLTQPWIFCASLSLCPLRAFRQQAHMLRRRHVPTPPAFPRDSGIQRMRRAIAGGDHEAHAPQSLPCGVVGPVHRRETTALLLQVCAHLLAATR